MTETYQNLTAGTLSTDDSFNFISLTDISAEINILLRRLSQQNAVIKKEEDDDLDFKLETKYQVDEETPQDDPIVTEDDLNVESENIDEKAKRFEAVFEPSLETPEQIEISHQDRQREWLDNFLRG